MKRYMTFAIHKCGKLKRKTTILKRRVEHLSEVLKILEGALKSNASMALNYGSLLADKLESEGESRQARMLRERLSRSTLAMASAQDASNGVSLGNLPADQESRLQTVDVSRPKPQDIELVLPSALQTRLDEFVQAVVHHDTLANAGAALPSRMLIFGPPGTGKTLTARWIAAHLRLPLLTVRCDTLVSSLLGQTSRNLRRVFEYATQTPSVLFMDEFDALAGARGNERDVGELQRVVIALLQNIDALPENTILVAATNHEQLLDPAIGRRFAFQLPVPLPDESQLVVLWKHWLGQFAPDDLVWSDLARCSIGATGALVELTCIDAKRSAILAGKGTIDQPSLYRRLGLTLALSRGIRLSTKEQEIRWLRNWQPERFSLRVLAALYGASTRKITTVLNEQGAENGNGHGH